MRMYLSEGVRTMTWVPLRETRPRDTPTYFMFTTRSVACRGCPYLGMWIPVFDGVGVVWWWFVNRIRDPSATTVTT